MKQLGAPSVFSFVFRREKLPVVRSKRDGSSRKITVYFHGNINDLKDLKEMEILGK